MFTHYTGRARLGMDLTQNGLIRVLIIHQSRSWTFVNVLYVLVSDRSPHPGFR